jgi:hypothetical protein
MALMADKKQEFLPFHVINEFMRDDFRLAVVRSVLHGVSSLPADYRDPIDRLTRKFVKVPGFRNSSLAPAGVRVVPTANAFEKNPELVGAILAAWAGRHTELRQQVYDLLAARKWELLPIEVNRARLPGFMIHWPKGEDFEVINKAFIEMYPSADVNRDDVSLMVVWLGARLPYKVEGDEEETEAEVEQPAAANE